MSYLWICHKNFENRITRNITLSIPRVDICLPFKNITCKKRLTDRCTESQLTQLSNESFRVQKHREVKG